MPHRHEAAAFPLTEIAKLAHRGLAASDREPEWTPLFRDILTHALKSMGIEEYHRFRPWLADHGVVTPANPPSSSCVECGASLNLFSPAAVARHENWHAEIRRQLRALAAHDHEPTLLAGGPNGN